MKAATVVSYGGPEVLTVCDVSMPEPGPDEALVAVVASTVNPVDVKFRQPGDVPGHQSIPRVAGMGSRRSGGHGTGRFRVGARGQGDRHVSATGGRGRLLAALHCAASWTACPGT